MEILKKRVYLLALILLITPFSCDEDQDFSVIEGLDFTIATLNAEGNRAGVLPSTAVPDNRIVYTVDFGNPDAGDDLFQTSGPLVMYDYPLETATYTITVTASLPGRSDVTITKEHTVIYIQEPDPDPIPAPSVTYANDDFEGEDGIETWFADDVVLDTAFANPDPSGINTSDTVLQYIDDGSGAYANIRFDVDPNFDIASNPTFTLKAYIDSSSITGSQPNQISLKLQNNDLENNSWQTQTEIIKTINELDQWVELTFDFSSDEWININFLQTDPAPTDRTDFNRVVLQFNSENNNDAVTAYIDDIVYEN